MEEEQVIFDNVPNLVFNEERKHSEIKIFGDGKLAKVEIAPVIYGQNQVP